MSCDLFCENRSKPEFSGGQNTTPIKQNSIPLLLSQPAAPPAAVQEHQRVSAISGCPEKTSRVVLPLPSHKGHINATRACPGTARHHAAGKSQFCFQQKLRPFQRAQGEPHLEAKVSRSSQASCDKLSALASLQELSWELIVVLRKGHMGRKSVLSGA